MFKHFCPKEQKRIQGKKIAGTISLNREKTKPRLIPNGNGNGNGGNSLLIGRRPLTKLTPDT